jgi:hypothetical protein
MGTLEGGEWPPLRTDRFTPEKTVPGSFCIGESVGHKGGLGVMEKRKILPLPGIKSRL